MGGPSLDDTLLMGGRGSVVLPDSTVEELSTDSIVKFEAGVFNG